MSAIPLTARGAERLQAELHRLKTVERPEVINAIAEARAQGDLSENAEYDAARERQGFIEGRIQELEGTLSNAQIINPAGLREVLDIADSYGFPLWISENGLADAADTKRPSYIVRHLAVINKAIADGMDIRGYTAWSLTDNLEWVLGYQPRYGLYSYDPATLERTPRPSVDLVRELFSGNSIPADVFRTYVRDPRV